MSKANTTQYTAAGGVVVRGEDVLVLRRPGRDEIRLPKGHVEPGEGLAEAALRETREETGYDDLLLTADLGTQIVEFDYRGQHIVRSEHYFLFLLQGDTRATSNGEAQFAPAWLPWDQAEAALTYEAEREWVRRARRTCKGQNSAPAVQLCLSTGSLYTYGLVRVFEMAAGVGFDGVELLVDARWDTRHPAYVRRLAEAYELPIAAVHSPFVGSVPGWPDDQLGRLDRTVTLAHELGADTVVTHLPQAFVGITVTLHGAHHRRFSLPVRWRRLGPYDLLLRDNMAEFERVRQITVCVENMPAQRLLGLRMNAYRFNDLDQMARFPHVVLDTTHLATWGVDPLAAYVALRRNVVHVHLSNYDARSGRGHHSPVDGDLPLAELLQRLARDGYSGAITVEADPATLDAHDPSACAAKLRRALSFCRENLSWADHVP